eukprot:232838-Pleurochrysis_carterae.AAC.7
MRGPLLIQCASGQGGASCSGKRLGAQAAMPPEAFAAGAEGLLLVAYCHVLRPLGASGEALRGPAGLRIT